MKITLCIDTSLIDTVRVAIECDGRRHEKISQSRVLKSQMVLPLIEEILAERVLKLSDITNIEVVTINGSFTGLRVGSSVANALGYLLDIPVNGKRTLVNPTY
jgi:tRNA threonylcarbamoyladenosine biosynthesis protein TsaB